MNRETHADDRKGRRCLCVLGGNKEHSRSCNLQFLFFQMSSLKTALLMHIIIDSYALLTKNIATVRLWIVPDIQCTHKLLWKCRCSWILTQLRGSSLHIFSTHVRFVVWEISKLVDEWTGMHPYFIRTFPRSHVCITFLSTNFLVLLYKKPHNILWALLVKWHYYYFFLFVWRVQTLYLKTKGKVTYTGSRK